MDATRQSDARADTTGQGRVNVSGQDLGQALRTGPFSLALQLAMQTRGLSLESLQRKLSSHGIDISLTTLSYWRRGRSRPERARSLRAVRVLEGVLDVPADSLVTLLGPRRPRGRWLEHTPGARPIKQLFPQYDKLASVLEELSFSGANRFHWINMHDKYILDEHRAESRLHVSQVVRAEADRLDRCLYIYNADDTVRPLPTLELPGGGRIGRVRSDQSGGFLVAELFFDQVLARGETAVLEYQLAFPPGGEPAMRYERSFHLPARQYVLEVQFHSAAVPAHCYQTFRPQATAGHETVRELWIGGSHTAHAVILDPTPGLHGIGWDWQ